MMLRSCCFLFLLGLAFSGTAQNEDLMKRDSVQQDTLRDGVLKSTGGDSIRVDTGGGIETITSYAKRYNPRKASLYAAVFPGAGQFYTRKYWKIPLVYTGFGFLIYAVVFSQNQYEHYRDLLFQSINDPNTVLPNRISQTQLRSTVDFARRQRDYFLILNFFFYVLQIVDAHVDAHLKEFDLNPKLQVRIQSIPLQNGLLGHAQGIGFVYKF